MGKRGIQEEVPGSSQGPEGGGQHAPPINKGGLKKPRLVTHLSQLQGGGGLQEGRGREKRMERSKKKESESQDGMSVRPPKLQELKSLQANTCLLGVTSGWGPSWVWA